MGAIELLYDYLEDHVRATALINERKPLVFGVFCFVVGGLSVFVAQAVANRLTVLSFSYTSCVLVVLGRLAAGFVLASVVHLILEMSGSPGSAASLFVLFGLADLAWALAVPLCLILRLIAPGSSWPATGAFLAVGLLSLSLKARGLQDNYRVAFGKAWLTMALPYLALTAAALLVVSLAVVGLIVHLMNALG